MSDALQTKILEAHDRLCARIVEFNNLPRPYGTALGLFGLLTPEEIQDRYASPSFQFSMADDEFVNAVLDDGSLEKARPYIELQLWESAKARMAFAGRLLALVSSDGRGNSSLANWHNDGILSEHLRKGFSDEEIRSYDFTQPFVVRRILDDWDASIVASIKDVHESLKQ